MIQNSTGSKPKPSSSIRNIPQIVYAGNIGDGQGLERIVPDAANRLEGYAQFKIVGDGSKKKN